MPGGLSYFQWHPFQRIIKYCPNPYIHAARFTKAIQREQIQTVPNQAVLNSNPAVF